MQPEGHRTGQATALGRRQLLAQQALAGPQRAPEALLLGRHHGGDHVGAGDQLGVGGAHGGHHRLHQGRAQGLGRSQLGPPAQGPADDAAQHVAPGLVGRQHPVGDEKGHGPGVVGQDAQAHVGPPARAVAGAGGRLGGGHDGGQHVGVEDRLGPGQDGKDAFQSRPGVDVLLGQLGERAVGGPVVLHEDQVPQLDVALVRAPGGTPAGAVVVALVVEDLRVGPTGAHLAHGPPVVLVAHGLHPVGGQAHLVHPDGGGLGVVFVHGDPQPVGLEAEDLGRQLPGHGDGVGLEVVAQAEVAEHLEEGEVAGVGAHHVDVVVLAPDPHAALDRGEPGMGGHLLAQVVGLEGHHAGHGEHHRGVGGHQRRRGQLVVAPLGEVAHEGLAQLVGVHHLHRFRAGPTQVALAVVTIGGGAVETTGFEPAFLPPEGRRSIQN